ncbi:MAG: 4-hydroxy-3-methylbut-2-en-1-yl diphosphate synthase [Tannerella sp.]|jgi:(E)-4-hydroxy-3-methylbut-2-enyl-diphosphate synthase|nr:4-hydroxy-3-methylbut-2-en-1-yl diphosphate synthase [Tannerella sp.]
MDPFNYKRRLSSVVRIGDTPLGGDYPVRIQSMANVSTMDTDAAVNQAIRMIDAGAEFVRFTARGEREAQNLQNIHDGLIRKGYTTPLVADIHFNPKVANVAALSVEKVRINPGNYIDKVRKFETITCTDEAYAGELQKIRDYFIPFLNLCRENNTAIRIGVNHGSLSGRIMSRYGDTPEGMVESCMEFLRLCVEEQFDRVVISIKASNTIIMIRTVRLLVRAMEAENMNYPLHLGVTEAGDGEDGRIKSAVGIGTLLADGVGDTIRVSLSEEPEAEMPVARKLADYIAERAGHPPINALVSPSYDPICPSRRKSRVVNGIGGNYPPVVISDRTNGDNRVNEDLKPDWIYTKREHITKTQAETLSTKFIINAADWNPQIKAYPCFSIHQKEHILRCDADTKFIRLTYPDPDDDLIRLLKTDPTTVVLLYSTHLNVVGEMRAFIHRLLNAECDVPVIFCRNYDDKEAEAVQIKAAADFGALLTDGFSDGIMVSNHTSSCDSRTIDSYMFGILQAARLRVSRTEYISCPGCGRTLFNLQHTIAQVKAATSHMVGLKIGIMGCIVNGPGEMADADYGYIGAGRGRINLYKGSECMLKNIPQDEAVARLIELIRKEEKL